MATDTTIDCFHCGDRIPPACELSVDFDGEVRPMCCAGCQAVAELIIGSGQGDYYRYREGPSARVDETLLDRLDDWDAFGNDSARTDAAGTAEIDVLIEGIHCAACGWLIETQLKAVPGVADVQVDIIGREARVRWDIARLELGDILRRIVQLGYQPHPGGLERRRDLQREERRLALRRLGVAGLGMMQVMMYAAGTYFAPESGIDPAIHRFLDLVSMLVATPVVLFSGAPFFKGAIRALAVGRINVDVPVALALGLAYGASCRNLLAGEGAVFFDSVSMFVFFLLLGRYVEMAVRHRSVSVADGLARLLPETAVLVDTTSGRDRPVPRGTLACGDRIRLRSGDTVPADGLVLDATARMDESLLTGESRPVERGIGEPVLAGSVNLGEPVMLEVTANGEELVVSRLHQLLTRARSQRPAMARQVDRIAGWLVAAILLIAVVSYGLWLPHDSAMAFQALLAVLVVTCPCALSLATPSALAAATVRLSRHGLLVFNGDALNALAAVDTAIFDKTGTLTCGQPQVAGIVWMRGREHEELNLLTALAALERGNSHPIASSLRGHDDGLSVDQLETRAGAGVTGLVAGRRLAAGSRAFVSDWLMQQTGSTERPSWDGCEGRESSVGTLFCADERGPLATVRLEDELRLDARSTLQELTRRGIASRMFSGDLDEAVADVTRQLPLNEAAGRLSSRDKLSRLQSLQQLGHRVLAVGDGVNDGPVLAGADVSVAMGNGSGIAQSGADLVLLGDRLEPLINAVDVGRWTQGIIRQNLIWALLYNATAVPLAALGLVAPWMAAIGMSASSLVVVLNAARLTRKGDQLAAHSDRVEALLP